MKIYIIRNGNGNSILIGAKVNANVFYAYLLRNEPEFRDAVKSNIPLTPLNQVSQCKHIDVTGQCNREPHYTSGTHCWHHTTKAMRTQHKNLEKLSRPPMFTIDELIDYIESNHTGIISKFYNPIEFSMGSFLGLSVICGNPDIIIGLEVKTTGLDFDHGSVCYEYNYNEILSIKARVQTIIDSFKKDFCQLFEGLLIPELANIVYEEIGLPFRQVTLYNMHNIDSSQF